jgi:rhodanese-related sulfurtransferase
MMDVAVPANMHVGLAQDEASHQEWALTVSDAIELLGAPNIAFVDLREHRERSKHGSIPNSLHAPYADILENVRSGGMLHELACAASKRLLFYCAYGERSTMAVRAAHGAGLGSACHIKGGISAWKAAGGPLMENPK